MNVKGKNVKFAKYPSILFTMAAIFLIRRFKRKLLSNMSRYKARGEITTEVTHNIDIFPCSELKIIIFIPLRNYCSRLGHDLQMTFSLTELRTADPGAQTCCRKPLSSLNASCAMPPGLVGSRTADTSTSSSATALCHALSRKRSSSALDSV